MPAGFDATFLALAAPFLAALAAPLAVAALRQWAAAALALVPVLLFLHFASFLPAVAGGAARVNGVPWAGPLDVAFAYRLDGLSLLFALLISGIGAFILPYAGAYLGDDPRLGRFLGTLLAFMGSMLGLVLADDLVMLFIFWELTSITSFLLIGFDRARREARRAALQALVVTGLGGLAMLAGFLLVIIAVGASTMTEALAAAEALRAHPLYLPILLLVLLGAFTKSAQVPFHSWLPNAMAAPTPVSAYLHSATMVKAGVYLVMRTAPALGGTPAWTLLLTVFGAATLAAGAALALRETDLKLILAQTTVASLGLLVLLVGLGTPAAATAAAAYLLAHALFKGALFMAAGGIDHGAGTRDLAALGGLSRLLPITFAASFVAAWSMGGLPLTLGFFAKETIYDALLQGHGGGAASALLLAVAVLGNAALLAAGFAVALLPFRGAPRPGLAESHEGPPGLWLGPVVLAAAGVVLVLAAGFTDAWLVAPTVRAIAAAPPPVHVSPAIHFGLPLALSIVTILLGVLLLRGLAPVRARIDALLARIGWGPDRGFDQALAGLGRLAAAVTALLQNGQLERYVTVTFAVLAAALLVPMVLSGEWPRSVSIPGMPLHVWAVMLVAAAGLVTVMLARTRLISIVSLGIQGFAVALLYMLFGAPDLSFTQFMVETLSVVVLALVMTRLSLDRRDRRTDWVERGRDAGIAGLCGLGFAALLVTVTAPPFDARLSEFFGAFSRPVAHGRNVVNVIIVDFRALDTLGEITVLLATGLAILALLRVRAERVDRKEDGP